MFSGRSCSLNAAESVAPKLPVVESEETREHGIQGQQWGISRGRNVSKHGTAPHKTRSSQGAPSPQQQQGSGKKLPPSSHAIYHAPGKALSHGFPNWKSGDHEKAAAIHAKNAARAKSTEEAAQHNTAAMGHQLAAGYLKSTGTGGFGGKI